MGQELSLEQRTPSAPAQRGYYIYITEACNLRCSYCFVKEKNDGRHLKRAMAGRILQFIREESGGLKNMYVHFFGGEPLIQPETVDWLSGELRAWCAERSIKLRLGITTNGILLTEAACEMLLRHEIGVQLSLDGSQKGNDVHRKPAGNSNNGFGNSSAFERVQIGNYIEHFGKGWPNCRMTLTVHNLPCLSQSIRELHEIGFKSFSIIPDSDGCEWTEEYLAQYEEEVNKVFEYWAGHRGIGINLIGQTIGKLMRKMDRIHLCQAGTGILGITVDGDIYPCHDFAGRYWMDPVERKRLIIGNVKTGYSSNSARFKKLLATAEVKSGNGNDCSACWAKWACGRGCPYMNYARCGEVGTVNATYCATTRINAALALKWMSVLEDYRFSDMKAGEGFGGKVPQKPFLKPVAAFAGVKERAN